MFSDPANWLLRELMPRKVLPRRYLARACADRSEAKRTRHDSRLVSRCPAAFSKGMLAKYVAQFGQALAEAQSTDGEFLSTGRFQRTRVLPRDLQ
jgi:hypothetical protein